MQATCSRPLDSSELTVNSASLVLVHLPLQSNCLPGCLCRRLCQRSCCKMYIFMIDKSRACMLDHVLSVLTLHQFVQFFTHVRVGQQSAVSSTNVVIRQPLPSGEGMPQRNWKRHGWLCFQSCRELSVQEHCTNKEQPLALTQINSRPFSLGHRGRGVGFGTAQCVTKYRNHFRDQLIFGTSQGSKHCANRR